MNKSLGMKLALGLSAFMLVFCIIFVLIFSRKISGISQQNHYTETEKRSFFIVVEGEKNKDSVNLFFNGAENVSSKYDCVVQLENFASGDNYIVQNNFSYAKDVNADGILIFSDDENLIVPEVRNNNGKIIPVVVTGFCSNDSVYSNLVKIDFAKLEKEISDFFGNNTEIKKTAVFISNQKFPAAIKKMESAVGKAVSYYEVPILENESRDEEFRKAILDIVKNNKADAIFCLSDKDTEIVSEILIDLNYTGKIKVIGIGENQKCLELEEKGVVAKLLKTECFTLGTKAMEKLFSAVKEDGKK